jgi:RNA polymerase sigma-70 factor (ECF subfamily)
MKPKATSEFYVTLENINSVLRPFAMRLTKNAEDANDLLQETALKAMLHKDKFSDGTNLKAWLYTIMRNTFITNYQRVSRRNTFIDTTDNLHFINTSETAENGAYNTFLGKDLENAISGIDKMYSQPFIMHFTGFKYNEIAETLCIPLGTVKNRIHIARKILQERLVMYA